MQFGTKRILSFSAIAVLGYVAGTLGTFDLPFANASLEPTLNEDAIASAEREAWTQAGTPGKRHEYLDQLVGEWEADIKYWMEADGEPMSSDGTVTREWVMDGRFIKETVHSSSPSGEFEAVGYSGYNNADGRYEFVWMDSMTTSISMEYGSYNPAEKTFTNYGTHRDPYSGKLITGRGVLDVSDPDRHIMTGYQLDENGNELKVFEGIFVRQ